MQVLTVIGPVASTTAQRILGDKVASLIPGTEEALVAKSLHVGIPVVPPVSRPGQVLGGVFSMAQTEGNLIEGEIVAGAMEETMKS